ncbi:MAG: hypothetical protein M1609_07430 [Firmicutes bacterium]|nr:hypothetical protein [Bacillota bacterium]
MNDHHIFGHGLKNIDAGLGDLAGQHAEKPQWKDIHGQNNSLLKGFKNHLGEVQQLIGLFRGQYPQSKPQNLKILPLVKGIENISRNDHFQKLVKAERLLSPGAFTGIVPLILNQHLPQPVQGLLFQLAGLACNSEKHADKACEQ